VSLFDFLDEPFDEATPPAEAGSPADQPAPDEPPATEPTVDDPVVDEPVAEPMVDEPAADERPPPPDQDQREIVRDALDATLFVEAGAGSGKSTALVGRVLQLVTTGTAELRSIAAITPWTRSVPR